MANELIRTLCEQIGAYGLECAQTKELAPTTAFADTIKRVEAALAAASSVREEARNAALEEAAQVCNLKYMARVESGHPREASTARTLAEEIRKLKSQPAAPEQRQCNRCGKVNPAEIHTCTPRVPSSKPQDEREAFEYWMLNIAKVIVGSSDPYPSGLERDYWDVWQAAWKACAKLSQPSAAKDAERIKFLEESKIGIVRTTSVEWKRKDGTKFHSDFYLTDGNRRYEVLPTLREAIDAAISAQEKAS